jgi:hypothetical protein
VLAALAKAKTSFDLATRLVDNKVFHGNKRGPKSKSTEGDSNTIVNIFKETRLPKSNTFKMDIILARIKFYIGCNLAYVHIKAALLGGIEVLINPYFMGDKRPVVEAESTMRLHDKEACRCSFKVDMKRLRLLISHLQWDSKKLKRGGSFCAIGVVSWIDGHPVNTHLGMVRMTDTDVGTAGQAPSFVKVIKNKIGFIPPLQVVFAVVDSCNVNVGDKGGVVALFNQKEKYKMYMVHCVAHKLHNTIGTGIIGGWGEDKSKKRQGSNSPVIFFLEQMASKVRSEWPQLKLYFTEKVLTCPECVCTRWNTYGQTATWLIENFNQLVIALTAWNKKSELNDFWVNVFHNLQDPDLMLKVTFLAEVSEQWSNRSFLWLEKDGSFHAAKIHWFIQYTETIFKKWIQNPAKFFPGTYDLGAKYRKYSEYEHINVEYITAMAMAFLHNASAYFTKKTMYWHEPPYVFAALGDDKHGPTLARDLLAKAPDALTSDSVSKWTALGLLTDPQLRDDLLSYAQTGVRPIGLQNWWNAYFGCLPITNARMESALKLFKNLRGSPGNYSPDTIDILSQIRMNKIWERHPLTDKDLHEYRVEEAEKRVKKVSASESREDAYLRQHAKGKRKHKIISTVSIDSDLLRELNAMQDEKRRKIEKKEADDAKMETLKLEVVRLLCLTTTTVTKDIILKAMKQKEDPRKRYRGKLKFWSSGTMGMLKILEDIVHWSAACAEKESLDSIPLNIIPTSFATQSIPIPFNFQTAPNIHHWNVATPSIVQCMVDEHNLHQSQFSSSDYLCDSIPQVDWTQHSQEYTDTQAYVQNYWP